MRECPSDFAAVTTGLLWWYPSMKSTFVDVNQK